MGELNVPSNCARHLASEAVARCDVCGKPVCALCRIADLLYGADFCSLQCQEVYGTSDRLPVAVGGIDFSRGLHRPIRTGLGLWLRNIPRLTAYLLPVAWALALVAAAAGVTNLQIPEQIDSLPGTALNQPETTPPPAPQQEQVPEPPAPLPEPPLWTIIVNFFLTTYGLVLTGSILGRQYARQPSSTVYWQALKVYLPWLVTLMFLMLIVGLGLALLIVPGLVLGVRLFWADKLALFEGRNPLQALAESWKISRGHGLNTFVFQILLALTMMLLIVPFAVILVGAGLALAPLIRPYPEIWILFFAIFHLLSFVFYGSAWGPAIAYFYGLWQES